MSWKRLKDAKTSNSSTEQGQETVEMDLEFDAPQWEDLQREKDLVEQGIWSAGSDIHDSWFKKVHPLHEPKINVEPQRKSIVDRKGNKLSLELSKTWLSKKSGQEVRGLKATKSVSGQRKISGSEHEQNGAKKARKCWNLDGCRTLSISPNFSDKQPKRSNNIEEDLSPMLHTNNRHMTKQRPEYDENGRRIQKGKPVICPAPSKIESDPQSSHVMLKSKRRSVNVVRPEASKAEKPKRRSCFTLSAPPEISTIPSRSTASNNSKLKTTALINSKLKTTASNNSKLKTTASINSKLKTTASINSKLKTTASINSKGKTTAGVNRQRSFKATEKPMDTENELIAQYNSNLAPKRAKK